LAEILTAESSGGRSGAGTEKTAVAAQADMARILDLTRQILEKAHAGEWDDLIALEAVRRPIIARCFDASRHALFAAGDAVSLQELRELNNRILEIGRGRRDELVKILADSGRQRRAADHYRRAGRG
jgi:hypothetical protein